MKKSVTVRIFAVVSLRGPCTEWCKGRSNPLYRDCFAPSALAMTGNAKALTSIVCGILLLGGLMSAGLSHADPAEGDAPKPRCVSDADCVLPGLQGTCVSPGTKTAQCLFQEINKVSVQVIVPEHCRICNVEPILNQLKALFPAIETESLSAHTPQAKKIIEEFKIQMLPAYLLSKDVEKEPAFHQLSPSVDLVSGRYYLKPQLTGVSYFLGRETKPGQLDLFLMLTDKNAAHLLEISKEIMEQSKEKIKVNVQLISKKNSESGEYFSPGGKREINEEILYACVNKYSPQKTWDYLSCRTKDIHSLFWQDCLVQNGINAGEIEKCVRDNKSREFLSEKVKLAGELNIFYSSLFLLENVEIFGAGPEITAQEILSVVESKKDKKK